MQFISDWWTTVSTSSSQVWERFAMFFPRIAGATIIAVLGWLIVWVVCTVLEQILRAVNLQALFESVKLESLVKKSGSRHDTTALLIASVKWVLYLIVFLAAVVTLDLPNSTGFVVSVFEYAGHAVSAATMIMVGFILASFLSSLVKGVMAAGNLGFGGAAATVVKTSLQVVTLIVALRELGLTEQQFNIAYIGLVAGSAIAIGLSVGLGAQKAAGKAIEDFWKSVTSN